MQSGWNHNNLETYQDWKIVNNTSVNPVPATAAAIGYSPDGISLTTIGPAYAGWLASKSAPILPLSYGVLTAYLEVYPTLDSLRAQAWEFDTRITDPAGNVYALDCNFVLVNGGMFQSVSASGAGWINTGLQTGLPPAGVWTGLTLTYSFDTVKKIYGLLSISFLGKSVSLTGTNPALALGWGGNLLVKQLQIDENFAGVAYGITYRNVNVSAIGVL